MLYRVVTTSGQIIEKSGTMAGGGNSNRHGLMRLKNGKSQRVSLGEEMTTETVEELENAVHVLGETVEDLQRRVNELTVGAESVGEG